MPGRPPLSEFPPRQNHTAPQANGEIRRPILPSIPTLPVARRHLFDAPLSIVNKGISAAETQKKQISVGDYVKGKTDKRGKDGEFEQHQGVVVGKGDRLTVTDPLMPGEPGNDTDHVTYDSRKVDETTAQPTSIPPRKAHVVRGMQDTIQQQKAT